MSRCVPILDCAANLFCTSFIVVVALGYCVKPASGVDIATVKVGNPGNAPDQYYPLNNPTGRQFGSVGYHYRMGTYEVTNDQYVELLNAVGPKRAVDLGLYVSEMNTSAECGVSFTNSNGVITFVSKPAMGNKPVNFVSWRDAYRFANWLHNGQGAGDTENGAYELSGNIGNPPERRAGARWFLPSEDEWYKSAYYDQTLNSGSGGYWLYPTRSNSQPTTAAANNLGDISNPGANVANYYIGSHWRPTPSDHVRHVTSVGSAGSLSESYYGTSDQGGNLWEIVDTPYESQPSWGIFRGGAWNDSLTQQGANLRASYRPVGTPTGNLDTGFRVATILPFVTGDINWDDVVDGADYTVWANQFGHSVKNWTDGDLTGDGFVDAADYVVWRNAMGQENLGLTAATHAEVPEPSTLLLLCFGSLAVLWRRRPAARDLRP